MSGGHRTFTWLKANTTSGHRFRAALPDDWLIADKTGTGAYGTANDVGITWTPKGTPLVLAVLTTHTTKSTPADEELVAKATTLLRKAIAPHT